MIHVFCWQAHSSGFNALSLNASLPFGLFSGLLHEQKFSDYTSGPSFPEWHFFSWNYFVVHWLSNCHEFLVFLCLTVLASALSPYMFGCTLFAACFDVEFKSQFTWNGFDNVLLGKCAERANWIIYWSNQYSQDTERWKKPEVAGNETVGGNPAWRINEAGSMHPMLHGWYLTFSFVRCLFWIRLIFLCAAGK